MRSIAAAAHVAEQLNEDIAQVFKTLVVGEATGPAFLVCVIPGDGEVNLKLAAKVSGNKKRRNVAYERTAAYDRIYSRWLFADRDEKEFSPRISIRVAGISDHIYVSAGVRGLQLRMAPDDLVRYADAVVTDLL